jgi:hypothetical protein
MVVLQLFFDGLKNFVDPGAQFFELAVIRHSLSVFLRKNVSGMALKVHLKITLKKSNLSLKLRQILEGIVFVVAPIATLRYNKVNVLQLKVCLLFLTLNIGEIF